MKKKFFAVFAAALLVFSMTACGGSDKDENEGQSDAVTEETGQTADTDIANISQDEIASLSDYEFYAANSSGADITDLYVAVTGADDWGSNLISSPIKDGTKTKITLSNLDPEKTYDVCVVDSNSNTTEYYSFDMKATVQITFYAGAQCDVSTI